MFCHFNPQVWNSICLKNKLIKTVQCLSVDPDLRDPLEAGPAAPCEVQDDRELVLPEQTAAVRQAAGQVLVVNEDKLHPHSDARLGGTKGISEPFYNQQKIYKLFNISFTCSTGVTFESAPSQQIFLPHLLFGQRRAL